MEEESYILVVKEEPEELIKCYFCEKEFANTVALNNHCRLYHTLECVAHTEDVTPEINTSSQSEKKALSNAMKQLAEQEANEHRQKQFMSTMKPVDLTELVSQDVSYLIIKPKEEIVETTPEPAQKKKRCAVTKNLVKEKKSKRIEETSNVKKPRKKLITGTRLNGGISDDNLREMYFTKRTIEPVSVSGVFECLQPSIGVEGNICHQIFFQCCEYTIHCRDTHIQKRKLLNCEICEQPLEAQDGDARVVFSCQVCNILYNSNRELRAHIGVQHPELRPFQCSVCEKRFSQQSNLITHMRNHTGEKPYTCLFCPKTFKQKSGLQQHIRTHTKIKPYVCVICNKAFTQPINLKHHMRTHTKIMPFECGLCLKKFKQSTQLTQHLKYNCKGVKEIVENGAFEGSVVNDSSEIVNDYEETEVQPVYIEEGDVVVERLDDGTEIELTESIDEYV